MFINIMHHCRMATNSMYVKKRSVNTVEKKSRGACIGHNKEFSGSTF